MNARPLVITLPLLLIGTGCATARPAIPGTPAGHVLQAWLRAFNSGNPAQIRRYVLPLDPYQSLRSLIAFRQSTGGFELLAIESSARMHIRFLVKQKIGRTRAAGDLIVKSIRPLQSRYFALRALPPGISPAVVTLDSRLRGRVIDGVAADLTQFYVHSGVAANMVSAMHAHQRAGSYRDLTDGYLFADRLTSDLRAVSHDLHLQITFSPFKMPPPAPPTAPQLARMRNQIERGNCAFEKLSILPGDVGYVKFNAFMPPAPCAGTVEAAMAFVAHTRALIFDLRDNGGGQPAMIAFIASYLFDRPTHLNDIYNRQQGTTTQFWTVPSLPGKRMSARPVFVLTSHRTFSGAEEFCYDLKNLKRATIVGETTGGGAHPVRGYRVADYFQVVVPVSEAINPITHTNWEGTGVLPDVKVPAADALKVAERLAARDIQAARARRRPEVPEPPTAAPTPGTQRMVRRLIEGWERGRPDYADMGPELQETALQQRAALRRRFARLGALRSLNFLRIGRDGSDVYQASFAHGTLQWRVSPPSSDGRIPGEVFRPINGKAPLSPPY